MSAHTPGPWHIEEGGFVVADPKISGPIVAEVPCQGGNTADLRLISAAPTLLKACQQAIYALKGREHDGFLRDAIEEATGARP